MRKETQEDGKRGKPRTPRRNDSEQAGHVDLVINSDHEIKESDAEGEEDTIIATESELEPAQTHRGVKDPRENRTEETQGENTRKTGPTDPRLSPRWKPTSLANTQTRVNWEEQRHGGA